MIGAGQSWNAIGPGSGVTAMFTMLTNPHRELTSSREGSRASRSAPPESDWRRLMSVGYGLSSLASFAYYVRASRSWRTSQDSIAEDLATFSGTWPRSGMTRNGIAYALPTLVPRTAVSGCSLWPTPTARDYKDVGRNTNYASLYRKGKLAGFVAHRQPAGEPIGSLNPAWVEWLMGFPSGWTDSAPSATQSCHK